MVLSVERLKASFTNPDGGWIACELRRCGGGAQSAVVRSLGSRLAGHLRPPRNYYTTCGTASRLHCGRERCFDASDLSDGDPLRSAVVDTAVGRNTHMIDFIVFCRRVDKPNFCWTDTDILRKYTYSTVKSDWILFVGLDYLKQTVDTRVRFHTCRT